jgi:MFS family permease
LWVDTSSAPRLPVMTDSGDRSVVASTLTMLTCLVLGLLAGGMLVIGIAFVSFWKSLSPSDFQAWFAFYSHLIGRLMIPLGAGSVAATAATLVAWWSGPATRRRWLVIAVLSAVAVMVTYPIVFARTNESFVRGGLSDSAVRSLLDCWATWHWIRTGLGILGFFAALRALHRS